MTEQGRVKWFEDKKGYGFILSQNNYEVFAHYSQIIVNENEYKTLNKGQKVQYDLKEINGKKQAFNIKIIK